MSVVFGSVVAVLVSLATAVGAGVSAVGGLAAGVVAWASWEGWRAIRAAAHDGGAANGDI